MRLLHYSLLAAPWGKAGEERGREGGGGVVWHGEGDHVKSNGPSHFLVPFVDLKDLEIIYCTSRRVQKNEETKEKH